MRDALELDAAQLEFARYVRSGDTVCWGQGGAEPCTLTEALVSQRRAIGGRFRVFVGASWSQTLQPQHADAIDMSAYCGSGTNRQLAAAGVLDIVPAHYSAFDRALTRGPFKVDVLLLQVAPADADGHYSLSIAHEYLIPLIDSARVVIAEVNHAAPWTYGERALRKADFDALIHTDRAPLEAPRATPGEIETRIAQHVATLIEDGTTLQLGLGALPDAILAHLGDRRDLGIHSGAIGDAVASLMARGVITNAKKRNDRGVSIAGAMMGSRKIYGFAHRNSAVQFRSTAYTHDIGVLAGIDRFAAINSAIEVDLTGQVNAEVANGQYLGSVGGAVDFLRGAARSRGGLPIVALPARSRHGSRIVARLSGPVSTPRSDVGLVVTEYGVADLRGLSLAQRTRRMLDIALPEARDALAAAHAAALHDSVHSMHSSAREAISS
ncbi:acetyl-CoA hydrolase/transferase family protein [Paraburkholderia strydomiana]|uniref:acetyl-CoA hydrolase/transferase family protein n=1 Tax=Paraburkholderia strydomiana TaxID=1245417 RepID=UPI0038B85004